MIVSLMRWMKLKRKLDIFWLIFKLSLIIFELVLLSLSLGLKLMIKLVRWRKRWLLLRSKFLFFFVGRCSLLLKRLLSRILFLLLMVSSKRKKMIYWKSGLSLWCNFMLCWLSRKLLRWSMLRWGVCLGWVRRLISIGICFVVVCCLRIRICWIRIWRIWFLWWRMRWRVIVLFYCC